MFTPPVPKVLQVVGSACVLVCGTLLSTAAWATDCPGIYVDAPPDAGGANDICTVDASGNVTCHLGANYDALDDDHPLAGSTISHYVTPTANGTEFIAYGTDALGLRFCSHLVMADPAGNPGCARTLTVYGSPADDEIHLRDTTAGWNMTCSDSTVWGDQGTDTIHGSDATNNHDALNGEEHADSIFGEAGDDLLDGGDGDDIIFGGDGTDDIDGGAGDDKIKAGNGNDYADGGTGTDKVCGGAGADTLYGSDGADTVVGDAGGDTVSCGGNVGDWADQVVCTNVNPALTCPW